MRPPRLFLLDGLALAYRSHFAFIRNPLMNSRGEHTSALFAFSNALSKLRDDEKPEYWALAWDAEGPTFRHQEYPEYKGTRPPMPEELVEQLPRLKEIAEAFGLPLLEAPGFEADDIMATLTERALHDNIDVVLVTNDKDLQQLIRPGVRMLAPRGRNNEDEWLGEDEVVERWGVRPEQLGDVLALMGDSSDNIPGVKGVGEKTAVRLIGEYGDLKSLYEHIGEIKQAGLKKKLESGRDDAFFSRHLIELRRDVEIPVTWEELKAGPPDAGVLEKLAERFELRRLRTWADRARQSRDSSAPALNLGPVPAPASVGERRGESRAVQGTLLFESEEEIERKAFGPPVRIVDTVEGAEALVQELRASRRGFSLDTETTSEEPMRAELVGIGLSAGAEPAYVPVRHRQGKNLSLDKVRQIFGPLFADESVGKIGQHLKYDILVLKRHSLPVRGIQFDTLIASYLLEPEGAHGLDHLSRIHLGVEKIPTKALIGSGKNAQTMDELPISRVGAYCGEDVHCTWLLRDLFEPELEKRDQVDLFRDVELKLIPVLVDMENEGVLIDTEFLRGMSETLAVEAQRLVTAIHAAAGKSFNVNSGPQLAEVLFKDLALPAKRQTKIGYSTSAEVLEELASLHALPRLVLQYRQNAKLRSTYVDALPLLVNPATGRVHTQFHQTVAATGRLSSSNPGLQNIPMRTALGRQVRKAFIPRPGWGMLGADYSQIELRIMAHLSGDEALRQAFENGEDVHASTARSVFGLKDREPSAEERARAKVVNFGIMYGMGARALSNQLGMSLRQASEFIRDYFRVHRGVKEFLDQTLREARETGYVSTVLGRRRYLSQLTATSPKARANADRAAINTPLQGSAADLIKVAMVRIHGELARRGLETKLILQVHDELLFEGPAAEEPELNELVRKEMIGAIQLAVPLEVSVGTGGSWFDVH